MRVLHVIPSVAASRGGPSYVVVELARALSAAGVEVEILATRIDLDRAGEGAVRERLGPSVRLDLVEAIGPRRIEVSPGMVAALWGRLARVDLVHVHTVFTFPVAVAPLLCRTRGVPHVVRPAGTLDADCIASRAERQKRFALDVYGRRNLVGADAVHATSDKEAAELRALVPPARVELVEVGVHAAARDAVPPDGGAVGRVVGSLGRLHPGKRLELLLRAVARLGPEVELALAGDGEAGYVASLRELAATLGLAGRVRWLGHIDGAAKLAFLASCDLLAFPSLHESFGVAVAEAMAAGRAVLVSPGVALAEMIRAADAGRIVAPDPEAWAAAITSMLTDGKTRSRRAESARTLAQRWRWETVAKNTLALYEKILRLRSETTI